MTRLSCALFLLLAVASAPPEARGAVGARQAFVVAVAQQPVPPARDEFVPVTDLPPQEQLPAAPLLIAAYAIMWAVLLAYVVSLWRRLGTVERDLRQLSGRIDTARRP